MKRREVVFAIGDKVLLSTKNIRLKIPGARKLFPRWIGPFKVIARVGEVAYRLKLPATLQIHVFHVSLLNKYVAEGKYLPPPTIALEEELFYEVERVLMHRARQRGCKTVRQRYSPCSLRTTGGEDLTVSRTEPPDMGGQWRNWQRPGVQRDSNSRPKQLRPVRALDVVTKLSTPGVVKACKAAALSVILPACLARTNTFANVIRAGLTTLTRPTLNQPLTELLGRLGLAPTLLLLAPTTTRACAPRSRPTTTGPTASTAATATTRASPAATSPTAATTTTASTSSTAAPTTAPTATSTTTAASSTTPATLALAVAALCTSRSSTDVLRNRDCHEQHLQQLH
ncbi:unnamed protein product [Closterium sp. NIES-53]